MSMMCNYLKNFPLEIHRASKPRNAVLCKCSLVQTENSEISCNFMYISIMLHFFKKTFRVQITTEDTESYRFHPSRVVYEKKESSRTLNRIRGR